MSSSVRGTFRAPWRDGFTTVGCLILLLTNLVVSSGWLLAPRLEVTLEPAAIDPELGLAWVTAMPPPSWPWRIGGDSNTAPRGSDLLLYESERTLGPAHSLHQDIRKIGAGAYSHWHDTVIFSTSDGSDPRTNGRTYRVNAPLRLRTSIVASLLAIDVAVLALLLPGWFQTAGRLVAEVPNAVYQRCLKRHARPIGTAVGVPAVIAVTAGASWLAYIWTIAPPDHNYSDTFLPTLWLLGEFELVEGSVYDIVFPHLLTWLPSLLASLTWMTGLTPTAIHTGMTTLSFAAGLAGLFVAAGALGRTPWAGTVAVLILPGCCLSTQMIGYSMAFWDGAGLAGYWGITWSMLLWALWLRAPSGGWSGALPYFLAGVLFDLHSTYGAIMLAVMLGGDAAAMLVASEASVTKNLRVLAVRVGAFTGAALPQAFAVLSDGATVRAAVATDQWWKLMAFRKPFHVFVWDGTESLGRLIILIAAAGVMLVVARPLLAQRHWVRLAATASVVLALCALSFVCDKLIPTPLIASLVLTRALFLVISMSVVMAAALPFLIAERSGDALAVMLTATGTFLLSLSAGGTTGAALVLIGAAAWIGGVRAWILVLLAVNLAVFTWLGEVAATTLAAFVALAGARGAHRAFAATASSWRRERHEVAAGLLALVLVPLLLFGFATRAVAKGAQLAQLEPVSPAWRELTSWLRSSTPQNALLLMPPYPYSTADVRHAHVIDYAYLGVSVYATLALPFELRALRELYGIDLAARTLDEIRHNRGRDLLCSLEEGYRALVADGDRIRALREVYPRLRFVVGIKPGVRPPQWTCGAQEGRLADVAHAFSNDDYVVYDLGKVPAPPPGGDSTR